MIFSHPSDRINKTIKLHNVDLHYFLQITYKIILFKNICPQEKSNGILTYQRNGNRLLSQVPRIFYLKI